MASFLKKVQNSGKKPDLASKFRDSLVQTVNSTPLGGALGTIDYDKYLAQPLVLVSKVWKRRGGMGKYAATAAMGGDGRGAWELRRMELRGTTLLYYNEVQETGAT